MVPGAPTGIWKLQPARSCYIPMMALQLSCCSFTSCFVFFLIYLFVYLFILLRLTTNKQTRKPSLIPLLKRQVDELIVGASWGECGLKCTSVLHIEKEKKVHKRRTAALCLLSNCTDFHCARNNSAPKRIRTKNI